MASRVALAMCALLVNWVNPMIILHKIKLYNIIRPRVKRKYMCQLTIQTTVLHNGEWVPGMSRGLYCGQLASRWTIPRLANLRHQATSPSTPRHRSHSLEQWKSNELCKERRDGEGGNPAGTPRTKPHITLRHIVLRLTILSLATTSTSRQHKQQCAHSSKNLI